MAGAQLNGSTVVYQCSKLHTMPPSPPADQLGPCELRADACMCSNGCHSTFECSASAFCSSSSGSRASTSSDVAMLLFFHFNRSWVRRKYANVPWMAYTREINRITWLLRSARAVNTTLPIHIVVARGSERNATLERTFSQLGAASTIESPAVVPPRWTSAFHKHSFSRLAALALTQFAKVIVLDNDMTLIRNIDELAAAETPAMVCSHGARD